MNKSDMLFDDLIGEDHIMHGNVINLSSIQEADTTLLVNKHNVKFNLKNLQK